MWQLTLLLVAAGAALPTLAIGWRRASPSPAAWDMPRTAGTYTGIIGSLAGFSVASAIFMSGLSVSRGTDQFLPVIGLLLIAFMAFIATAMMFGTIPNVATPDRTRTAYDTVVSTSFLLANCGFYMGISISWLALRPLLGAVGLWALARVFVWLLLTPVCVGALRMAVYLRQMMHVRASVTVLMPIIGIAAGIVHAQVVARVAPSLWPTGDARFAFATVAFIVNASGLAVQTVLLLLYSHGSGLTWMSRNGHRVAIVYVQTVVTTVTLLWFAIARS